MQFLYLTTAIILSIGVSSFAGYEASMKQADREVFQEVRITEMHGDMMMRAIRREIQLNPGSFTVPNGTDEVAVSENVVDRVYFGGFKPRGLLAFTFDALGNVHARIDDRLHDRRYIEDGILKDAQKQSSSSLALLAQMDETTIENAPSDIYIGRLSTTELALIHDTPKVSAELAFASGMIRLSPRIVD